MKIINLNFKETLLAILILLSFFTNFRFLNLPIGLSELLFFPLIIYVIYIFLFKQGSKINFYDDGFLIFLTLLLISFFTLISMNLSLLNSEFKHINMLHNSFAFIYLTMLVFIFIILQPNYEKLFNILIVSFFFISLFFYCYTFFNEEFLGRSLFYANTKLKSLFAKNHHQLAFFSTIVFLLTLNNLIHTKKAILIFPLFFYLYLLYILKSDGNNFGFLLSLFFSLIIFTFIKAKIYNLNKIIILIFILILFISPYIVSLNINFNKSFYEIINNKNILFRITFIQNFIEKTTFMEYLIGHGPGGFVISNLQPNHLREVHNTFFDLLLYSGIFSFILLIYIYYKTISKLIYKNMFILLILILYIFFYSLTHNIARYPIFWIIILYILSTKINKNKNEI